MKTKNIFLSIVALIALCASPFASNAQRKPSYITADWQIAVPFGDFAAKTSGWGANVEVNYYVAPKVSVGAFMSWHTNNEYTPRMTYQYPGTAKTNPGAITTDKISSLFQLPFGGLVRYDFMEGKMLTPYIGAKLGANYSEQNLYFQDNNVYDDNWGFYAAPELGVNIFPTQNRFFGIHVAAGYNFATNQNDAFDINGLSGFAVRLGATFRL